MVYFLSHFAYICMSKFSNHWHALFLVNIGLLSNCQACCCQLVKILITLEPYGIFGSYFAHLFILILSSHWYPKRWRGYADHHCGRSMSFSENAQYSWTALYILIKFCILIHFNIIEIQVCKTVNRLCQEYFVWQSLVNVLHTCVSILLKCIRTRFRMELFQHSERLCWNTQFGYRSQTCTCK